jgi:hypothetical protein
LRSDSSAGTFETTSRPVVTSEGHVARRGGGGGGGFGRDAADRDRARAGPVLGQARRHHAARVDALDRRGHQQRRRRPAERREVGRARIRVGVRRTERRELAEVARELQFVGQQIDR